MVGHWLSKVKIGGSNPTQEKFIGGKKEFRRRFSMEFYKSERGGDVCLYQAFEYLVKRRKADGTIQWWCRE